VVGILAEEGSPVGADSPLAVGSRAEGIQLAEDTRAVVGILVAVSPAEVHILAVEGRRVGADSQVGVAEDTQGRRPVAVDIPELLVEGTQLAAVEDTLAAEGIQELVVEVGMLAAVQDSRWVVVQDTLEELLAAAVLVLLPPVEQIERIAEHQEGHREGLPEPIVLDWALSQNLQPTPAHESPHLFWIAAAGTTDLARHPSSNQIATMCTARGTHRR